MASDNPTNENGLENAKLINATTVARPRLSSHLLVYNSLTSYNHTGSSGQ